MLALKSAINAAANSNIEIILTPKCALKDGFVKSSAFQDGFIAPKKWFRCGNSSVVVFLRCLCGGQDTWQDAWAKTNGQNTCRLPPMGWHPVSNSKGLLDKASMPFLRDG
jgi:hypothetical protein